MKISRGFFEKDQLFFQTRKTGRRHDSVHEQKSVPPGDYFAIAGAVFNCFRANKTADLYSPLPKGSHCPFLAGSHVNRLRFLSMRRLRRAAVRGMRQAPRISSIESPKGGGFLTKRLPGAAFIYDLARYGSVSSGKIILPGWLYASAGACLPSGRGWRRSSG